MEHLFVTKWCRGDGIAAIIISPTRELAYQIFETLKKIGKYHDFSAGLIIGGKNLKFERNRMDQCNILICTPGRLLQHMDENPLFNATTMELLVLDEADRCLDMGFEKTLNAIIENFPPQRQTLLFSATQTDSVKDLARLNLQNPKKIGFSASIQETKPRIVDTKDSGDVTSTKSDSIYAPPPPPVLSVPELLQQNYVVVSLEDKITVLWSFIQNHKKQKIIVFLSTCKQVKYIYEMFCKLRPGIGMLALYGTLHQDRRITIYEQFTRRSSVVMFATDVASRGLDFPSVNWVVQMDCPEDVNQYIHRAGRSARNRKRGECLLVLMPNEVEPMLEELRTKKSIEINKLQIDPKRLFSPRIKMEAHLAQDPELKATAQRAFVAYIKSIFLMRNKRIFDVRTINFDAFAQSLGLVVTPRVRFLERYLSKKNFVGNSTEQTNLSVEGNVSSTETKITPTTISEESHTSQNNCENLKFDTLDYSSDENKDDKDDFLTLKRVNHGLQGDEKITHDTNESTIKEGETPLELIVPKREKRKHLSKAAMAKRALKKKLRMNDKCKFDEDGNVLSDPRKQMQSDLAKEIEKQLQQSNGTSNADYGGIDLEMSKKLLRAEDQFDKLRFRDLVKERHKKLKKLRKQAKTKKNSDDENDGNDDGDDIVGDDWEDESDNSVDLSWLPDPSKVYNKDSPVDTKDEFDEENANSERSSGEDEIDTTEDEMDESRWVKRPKLSLPSSSSNKSVTNQLSLADAEAIAAQLLAHS